MFLAELSGDGSVPFPGRYVRTGAGTDSGPSPPPEESGKNTDVLRGGMNRGPPWDRKECVLKRYKIVFSYSGDGKEWTTAMKEVQADSDKEATAQVQELYPFVEIVAIKLET